MRRRRLAARTVMGGAAGLALAGLIAAALWLTRPQPAPPRGGITVGAALGGSGAGGYAQVLKPRPFVFPADFGPHPRYRNEWWYFTGNLRTHGGRHFGYELTVFRIALAPRPPVSPSPWATNQLYMAHFAITDVAGRQFHDAQRLARGAVGLAGAQASPFHVWVDNWQIRTTAQGAAFPWRLHAATRWGEVDLTLRALTSVIPEGDRGFSRKSAGAGHASYYYSIPRLATRGHLRVDGQRFDVSGLSWLDREWSSGALAPDQAGWDWFALQLKDGTDFMFYRLRDRGGATDPHSAGTWIESDGRHHRLGARDVLLQPLRWWRSGDGTRYPVAWRVRIPGRKCRLTVTPLLDDQALTTLVRYWEGAVRVHGRCGDRAVNGHGYLELTGYDRHENGRQQ